MSGSCKNNNNSMDDVDRLFACFKGGLSPPPSALRERKRSKSRFEQGSSRNDEFPSRSPLSGGSVGGEQKTPSSCTVATGLQSSIERLKSAAAKAKCFGRGKQISPIVFYGSPRGEGLALGLLSFSQVDLEVLVKAGQPQIQKNAAKIMSIVKNEHLLLSSLLLAKSLALEGVSTFMEKMFPDWLASLIVATFLCTIAEIIPQALCSRYGLTVGATMSPFVRVLLLIFFPIAYPISKLLDWLLGKGHAALLGRAELKTLVNLHANEAGKGGELSLHETTIIAGALDLTQKTAKDAMTPIGEAFSLDLNSKLDMHTMALIISKGHSRIPIYSGTPTNIIGVILVKNLIFCHPEDETPVRHMTIRRVPRVGENWPLYDILNQFRKGQSHMAVVIKCEGVTAATDAEGMTRDPAGLSRSFEPVDYISMSTDASNMHPQKSEYYSATLKNAMRLEGDSDAPCRRSQQLEASASFENLESFPVREEVIGIITLEDVLEELLQDDILDETDQYVDVHQNIKIKLQNARRLSSGSSRRASTSRQQRSSSDASRLCILTPPTCVSPISPSNQS